MAEIGDSGLGIRKGKPASFSLWEKVPEGWMRARAAHDDADAFKPTSA
ncbi:hypothetical protein CPBF367_21050 [Xanthomonas arboricola pv. juglandis]|nr:hypothetical protein CPBF367_21050 [Xanthomonas arboricola pv. juglandis]